MTTEHRIRSLHWEQSGHGIPVLFLHPKPADHDYWLIQRARFSTWYRTIVVDLPGYGESPVVDGSDFSFDDVSAACWRVLDAAKVGRAAIVGLSLGSRVAQHMAAQQADRTLALVLTGGGYFEADDARYRGGILRTMEHYRSQVPETRKQKVLDAFSPEFAAQPMAAYFAELYDERMARMESQIPTLLRLYDLLLEPIPDVVHRAIVAPTLVITGDRDPGHLAHRELARRLDAELAVVEGAGHFCNLEQPWLYDDYLSDFLLRQGLGRNQEAP